MAIGASVASLAGLFLFPVAFPLFSTIGALAAHGEVALTPIATPCWIGRSFAPETPTL